MPLHVDDDAGRMWTDMCDTVALLGPDGWTVTGRDGVYDRNQAISAMTVAEALATGLTVDHPLVRTLEAELEEPRHG